jgi:hypothetical protein
MDNPAAGNAIEDDFTPAGCVTLIAGKVDLFTVILCIFYVEKKGEFRLTSRKERKIIDVGSDYTQIFVM